MIRLQKVIANAGLTSRREAERWIAQGKVSVNGSVVTSQGVLVDPDRDQIVVNGTLLKTKSKKSVTYALYKPKNCLTTMKDPYDRETITKYFPSGMGRLFPVGRLDYDAEGLILITNDGELANKIMHPGSHVWKTYFVKIKGLIQTEELSKIRKGPVIEGKKRQQVKVKVIHSINDKTWLEVSLQEGVNRQIKKMFANIGYRVLKIKRYSIGNIELLNLSPGQYRLLSEKDINQLISSSK